MPQRDPPSSLVPTLVRLWTSWMLAACVLAAPEAVVVVAREGRIGIGVAASQIGLAGLVGVLVAGALVLPTLPARALPQVVAMRTWFIALRGAAWGASLGAAGVIVLQPWTVHDPYRLDVVTLGVGIALGMSTTLAIARDRRRFAVIVLATCGVAAWSADAFVQRHHFALLHDLAGFVALVGVGAAVFIAHAQWYTARRGRVLAVVAVVANLVVLIDARAIATAGVFHGVLQPKLMALARASVDFDRDGFSALIGGGDCNDVDESVHPGRCERAGAVDDNCNANAEPTTLLGPAPWPRHTRARPDVYVVIVDALRADYGGRSRPPAFERLAAASLDFSVAYTPYPSTMRGLVAFAQGRSWRNVSATASSLPVLLRDAGWRVDLWHGRQRVRAVPGDPLGVGPSTATLLAMDKHDKGAQTVVLIDDAIAALADQSAPPRFTWLHVDDPHWPWTRGSAFEPDRARYVLEVEHVDAQLGRLLDALDGSERGRAAILVLIGDHGEEIGEHGGSLHGGTLYEEVTRVPMILRLPGVTPRRIDDTASTLDVLPTLLHHLGLADPGGLEGVDWLAPPPPPAPRVLSEIVRVPGTWSVAHRSTLQMARSGAHKLVYDVDRNVYRLYDLDADPGETRSVAATEPEALAALLAALTAWQDADACTTALEVAAVP